MAFFNKTQKEIKDEMLQKVRENLETKNITNFNPGGVMRGFLEIVAFFIYVFYEHLNRTFDNVFAETAKGIWLDKKCKDVGITRKTATKTRLYITFGRNEVKDTNVKIKAGSIIKTRINYKGEEYLFQTINEAVLNSNTKEVDVLCESLETGQHNNLISNTPIVIVTTNSGIDYVRVGDNKIVEFGTDNESDEELRQRYYMAWKGLNIGGKDYYRNIASKITGVKQVTVYPIARGAGTLDIVITSVEGLPSDDLVNEVQAEINNNLQFDGIDVIVEKPVIVNLNVTVSIVAYYLIKNEADFKQDIIDLITNYCNQFEVGQDFIESQVKSRLLTTFNNIKDIAFNTGNVTVNNREWLKVNVQNVVVTIDGDL